MTEWIGRILAVDPGEKRIGLAISDPMGMIANPLDVIEHVAREKDAARIVEIAREHEVVKIVIGQPLDADGSVGLSGRKSKRLAKEIRKQCDLEVVLWDESGSTQKAKDAYVQMGVSKKKRRGHLDKIAATVILQSYLDAVNPPSYSFEDWGDEFKS
ncbi:MAG: Holliday junction resolvase RuvX [Anaerolineaceae bacterium]|nr:Holliday junction resolvase RuvX [Anaerolineaceae bacterium]